MMLGEMVQYIEPTESVGVGMAVMIERPYLRRHEE